MSENNISFLKDAKEIIFAREPEDDYIIQSIEKQNDFYEHELLDWLATISLEDGVIIDAGANIGNHSIYFSKILNKQVYSFEPNPKTFKLLTTNYKLNNLSIDKLFNKALGEFKGHCNIDEVDSGNLGATQVHLSNKGQIEVVSLDEFISQEKKIALIKIDVEGFELNVLRGAIQILKLHTPLLLVECITDGLIYETQIFLKQFGYLPITIFGATPMVVFCHEIQIQKIFGKNNLGAFNRIIELYTNINNANTKYREVNKSIEKLKTTKQELESKLQTTQKEKESLKQELDQARKKYRFVTEQIRLYKEQESEYNAKLKQYIKSEEKFKGCRASSSYRLGHLLIHETNSLSNIIKLPRKILDIKKTKESIVQNPRLRSKNETKIIINATSDNSKSIIQKESVSIRKDKNFILDDINKIKDKKLVVATVMDDFSFVSYKYECDLNQLTPNNWQEELEQIKPELLLIESAWRGKDELWGSKVGHKSQELIDIVNYCNAKNIPTAFWNKEDPIHFQTFVNVANIFDFVFTTDIDMIEQYKALLNHNNVYLLPFAAQPKFNNPIEKYERKDAFCFAGAYYVKYPERTKDLGNFVLSLSEKYDIEIYDRNYGKDDENYMFPKTYQPFIVGTLPFEEIDKAYKGYNYAINLNSIKQSQTMFARRIYELLASNTITISNFSRGLRLLFGDLVITTDSGDDLLRRVGEVSKDELNMKKIKLLALRSVMSHHTYQDRFAYICQKIYDFDKIETLPNILVIAKVSTQIEYNSIVENYLRQNYQNKKLVIVSNAMDIVVQKDIPVVSSSKFSNNSQTMETPDFLSFFSSNDYYGESYLIDMALATRYSEQNIITKQSYYKKNEQLVVLNKNEEYKEINRATLRKSIINKKLFKQDMIDNIDKYVVKENTLSIDSFNYAQNSKDLDIKDLAVIKDINGINQGIEFEKLLKISEQIEPAQNASGKIPSLTGKEIAEHIKLDVLKNITLNVANDTLLVDSNLKDETHQYIYLNKLYTLDELQVKDELKIFFETTPGLNISLVVVYQDKKGNKLHHYILTANKNYTLEIPEDTSSVKLGLRVYANGNCEIKNIFLAHKELSNSTIVGQSKHLVLTNHYPSYDDLYKNTFVHSRVRAYKQNGVDVDVYRLRVSEALEYNEFENIDVLTGDQKALDTLLSSGEYKSVLVHFLSPEMWEVLEKYIDTIKIVVWVHGAEIHPWYRRKYNLTTQEEIEKAKEQSESRMTFWHEVLDVMHKNLHLVFVSNSFSKEVFEDIGYELPKEQYSIIHNPIDTKKFNYIPKNVEQRKKILSIRPFASRQYANDISVQVILALAKKPFFEELQFHIIGDGKLFDETIEPIKYFKNVKIERKFINHEEIAQLHKEYGLFLCPTRWDSQGVSRDEAMASGLVPITNAIAAIPEFVDSDCGVLAEAEDYKKLAEGIEKLYNNEELFFEMSKNAHSHVMNRDKDVVVIEELDLFQKYQIKELLSILVKTNNDKIKTQIFKVLRYKLKEENRLEESLIALERYMSLSKNIDISINKEIKSLKKEVHNMQDSLGIYDEHKNFLRRYDKFLDYPEYVQIETFAYCNASCGFCPYSEIDRQTTKMSEELFYKIINGLTLIPKEHKFLIGLNHTNEPLADTRIGKFIKIIQEKLPNAMIDIITNGYLLNELNMKMLNNFNNINSVQISLNEVEKTRHEVNMGFLKFDTIVENLDILHTKVIKDEVSFKKVILRRVGDYTQNDQEFIDFCSVRWPNFSATSRGLKEFMGKDKIVHLGREKEQVNKYFVPIVACTQWYHLVIGANGKVAMCCFDGNIDYPQGDTNEESVLDIYNSKYFRKMRENKMTRQEAPLPCKSCSIYWGKGNLSYEPKK